jgi:receptor protein-tyrosine kinase/non-specific protein-tyrosine kinase
MDPVETEAPDLRDYLRLIWRRGWIMLVCLLAIPLAVYEYTASKPKVFESSTILQVQPSAVDSGSLTSPDFAAPQQNLDAVATFVSTTAVSDEAARRLGLPEGSLRGAASASADPDTNFLTITATGSSAQRAAAVATAFAEALNSTRAQRGQKRVDEAVATLQKALASTKDPVERAQIRTQLQKLATLKQASAQNATVLEPAHPGKQTAPHPRRNATAAILLALLVGAGLIVLTERLDRRLRKPEDLEKLTGLPFLATIPHEAFPGTPGSPDVPEAFQTLRNSLTFFNADQQLRSIMVASALKGEGKTTVAMNLGLAYASFGKRVILVDTDLRKPDLAARMGFDDRTGLTEVLAGTITLDEALREVAPFGGGLRLLSGGPVPPNPSALLGSLRMASLIEELCEDADMVIFDSTPLLMVSDAFPLLDKVSGVVALARLDKTPRDAIRRMVQITASAGAQVFGMVATDGKRRIRGGYGYGYGYGAGYGERPKKTPVSNTMPPPIVAGADNGGAPESENAEQGWPQTQA